MSLTASTFRALFPEFANVTTFPDLTVETWLGWALKLLNAERWGELMDMGQGLMTAHHLILGAQAAKAVSKGMLPGGPVGVQSSKSAGGVSVSYDISSATLTNAGHWNQTQYGVRYYQMSRMMGAGPVQIGADVAVNNVSAWYGPPYLP